MKRSDGERRRVPQYAKLVRDVCDSLERVVERGWVPDAGEIQSLTTNAAQLAACLNRLDAYARAERDAKERNG